MATQKFKDWYDEKEGILRVDVYERFDGETADMFFSGIPQKYNKEQQRYWLVNMSDDAQRLVDKEVRVIAAEKGKALQWEKIAICGAKPGLRMVSKIVLTAVGKGSFTKFFSTEEEALAWLKEMQAKDKTK
jgi:hypothetical protein